MSDDSAESSPSDPTKKPMSLSVFVSMPDLSAFMSKPVDLSAFMPKSVELPVFMSKPVDLSAFMPKVTDLAAFMPNHVDPPALFPWLDASLLIPRIDLSFLVGIDASVLSRISDGDAGFGVDAESSPTAISPQGPARQELSDREVATMLTIFVFLVVCIGLSIASKDYSQIARLSQITGASPFDVAMGFGALTFWLSYSRRSPNSEGTAD